MPDIGPDDWGVAPEAAALHRDMLVWDDHGGFAYKDGAMLAQLERWRASGIDYLSINAAYVVTALSAAGVFVLRSAAIYLVNDLADAEADRLHPDKARRPVASGELPKPVAASAAVLLLAGWSSHRSTGTGSSDAAMSVALRDARLTPPEAQELAELMAAPPRCAGVTASVSRLSRRAP